MKRKKEYVSVIDEELDLHGCTSGEAREEVEEFLHEAKRMGWSRVRIIVGKGTHSPEGPVLPQTVKAVLAQYGYTYTFAKIQNGGEGALEVTL